jgi:WD40 repeat protein/serine/threonine protein kinase
MISSSDQRNPVEILAEEFLDRKRRGEMPTLREYLERHPDLADEIRDLFPALLMVEDLGEDSGGTTGSLAGDGAAAVGARLEWLGDYRILREVGRGGMGVVYEAEQESLGRRVALKVLSASALVDINQIRRFEREARAAARLHHTNIVPVFGVGQQDGHHYYVMQFIAGLGLDLVLQDLRRLRHSTAGPATPAAPGEDVRDRRDSVALSPFQLTAAEVARSLVTGRFVRKDSAPVGASTTEPFDGAAAAPPKPISAEVESSPVVLPGSSELSALSDSDRRFYQGVARIGVQVAEALDYANRQGVLHRDIKPSNLLLDNRGNVWVADFGLAKTAETDDLTHTGDILGTIRYMAPERFQGSCDARSDLYSLGLTLYELVALQPAYQGTDRHTLMERVLHEEPARLKKLAPRVPRDLETIIAKAIAHDPAVRYATAAALGEDLQRFIEERPVRARRASLAERAWRWSRRNRGLAAMTAALASLLLMVAIGASLSAFWFRDMARTAELNRYFSDVALAHRELMAENPGRAEKLLDGCPSHLRGWEWHYLKRQSHTALMTIPAHDDYVFNVVYSPDGKSLATSSEDGTARVFDAATGRLIHTLRGHYPDICWRVTYSPDGKLLASGGRDKTVKIWEAATGDLLHTLTGNPDTVYGVSFSPDGCLLAAGSTVTKLWDTRTWQEIRPPLPGGGHVTFSPNGRLLGSYSGGPFSGGRIQIWDVASLMKEPGPVHPIVSLDASLYSRPAFSPDSRSVAVSCDGNIVKVLDVESRETILTLRGHTNEINEVVYSLDGHYLASSSDDQTVRVWDAADGRPLRTFRGHTHSAQGVSFSPDCRRLASSSLDGTVKIWDVTNWDEPATQQARTLARQGGAVLNVMHCPRGRFFATVNGLPKKELPESFDYVPERVEIVTIWNGTTGQAIHTLTVPDPTLGACHDVAFDPEFQRIAWARGNGTVEICDGVTNRLMLTLRGHSNRVERVVFSPNGRWLASASRGGTVRVWDAVSGQLIRVFPGFSNDIHGLEFSRDGRRLAMAAWISNQLHPAQTKVWDMATGRPLATPGEAFTGGMMALHPDSRRLARSFGAEIVILDLASGREHRRLRGHTGMVFGGMAFSPDGSRLASAAYDGTVKLWDVVTGREVLTLLHGRDDQLSGVSFSPDGRQLVSTSKSGTVKVWDATPLPEASMVANGLRDRRADR